MLHYLFSPQGRVNRGQFWASVLFYLIFLMIAALLLAALWQVVPGERTEDGSFSVNGPRALPYLIVSFGTMIALTWSGIVMGIKRYHDRNKSGFWILIQFVPVVGAIWYLVEAGFLAGTPGPNDYGPAPGARFDEPAFGSPALR